MGRTGHVGSVLGDAVHVGAAGTTVHRGDIATAQRLDTATKGLEQCRSIGHVGLPQNHRFAPTLRQSSQSGLVTHATGQPHGVGNGILDAVVRQVTAATERRTKLGVMDRNNGFQPGRLVGKEVQALHSLGTHRCKHGHSPAYFGCLKQPYTLKPFLACASLANLASLVFGGFTCAGCSPFSL